MGRDSRQHPFGGPRRSPSPSSLLAPGGVPILGQRAEVLDAYGKSLAVGDVVLLQTVRLQPYLIVQIGPAEGPTPGLLRVDLRAQAAFVTASSDPVLEFVLLEKKRVADPPAENPVDPPPDAPPEGPPA